jgi:hypothetical protein
MNPGDTLEGHGALLQQGRLVAGVAYHLTVPGQTISLAEYTLELADKSKRTIRIERRYKKMKHKGQERISFWVKIV